MIEWGDNFFKSTSIEEGGLLMKAKRVYVPSSGGRKAYYRQDPRDKKADEERSAAKERSKREFPDMKPAKTMEDFVNKNYAAIQEREMKIRDEAKPIKDLKNKQKYIANERSYLKTRMIRFWDNTKGDVKTRAKKEKRSKGTLLAASSSEEGIKDAISKYFMGSTITLNKISDDEYTVSTLKGLTESFRVVVKKGRYRFEEK